MEKCRQEIEQIFETQLKTAIAPAVLARNTITQQRQQIEADRQAFLQKIEANKETISSLDAVLDEKIINGKPADEVLHKLSTRQGELRAYERQIQRLADQDTDAALSEKNANQALSVAIGKALEGLRPAISKVIETTMQQALTPMVYFQHLGEQIAGVNGVSLPRDVELAVFRFLDCHQLTKDIEAFTGQIGEDFSMIRRREVKELFFARLAEQQRKSAA